MSILGIVLLLAAVIGTIYFGYGVAMSIRDIVRKKRESKTADKKK